MVLVNTNGYFNRFADFLTHAVSERFMAEQHLQMWSLIDEPEEIIEALRRAPAWSSEARQFAAVRD